VGNERSCADAAGRVRQTDQPEKCQGWQQNGPVVVLNAFTERGLFVLLTPSQSQLFFFLSFPSTPIMLNRRQQSTPAPASDAPAGKLF